MHIAITGGCGFLGQHVTRALLDAVPHARIRMLDLARKARSLYDFSREPRVEERLGVDICDADAATAHFEDVDLVVHLAGLVSFARQDRNVLYRVNVGGTRTVIAACEASRVSRLIHISSVAALGYDTGGAAIDEEYAFDWSQAERIGKHYMLSKRRADELVRSAIDRGLDALILYPGLMFGPGDYVHARRFVHGVRVGGARVAPPGGTNVVDVRDVARGIVAAITTPPRSRDVLLSGHNIRLRDLSAALATCLAAPRPRFTLPEWTEPLLLKVLRVRECLPRPADLNVDVVHSSFRFRYYNAQRAESELGWRPAISIEAMLRDTVSWLHEQDT